MGWISVRHALIPQKPVSMLPLDWMPKRDEQLKRQPVQQLLRQGLMNLDLRKCQDEKKSTCKAIAIVNESSRKSILDLGTHSSRREKNASFSFGCRFANTILASCKLRCNRGRLFTFHFGITIEFNLLNLQSV